MIKTIKHHDARMYDAEPNIAPNFRMSARGVRLVQTATNRGASQFGVWAAMVQEFPNVTGGALRCRDNACHSRNCGGEPLRLEPFLKCRP